MGGKNARILADILNKSKIRKELEKQNIIIPDDTYFIAAEHNTTTDDVIMHDYHAPKNVKEKLLFIKKDLYNASVKNCLSRSLKIKTKQSSLKKFKSNIGPLSKLATDSKMLGKLGAQNRSISEDSSTTAVCSRSRLRKRSNAVKNMILRSQNWAQTRPEWGLAQNASFIIGPRWLTQGMNLEARSFLHSYNWDQDYDGASLAAVLNGSVAVAQWINAQHLFSTIDNIAFGSGSKITQNITGKIGIIQGNASDLMHGLPLQSVYINDNQPYHKPARLIVIIYAPKLLVKSIINKQSTLKRLFDNKWIHLICIEPIHC